MNRVCAFLGAIRPFRVVIMAGFVLAFGLSASASGVSPKPDSPGQFLTGPADGPAIDIVLAYIAADRGALGLLESDLTEMKVDHYLSAHSGVTHIEIHQLHRGIEVHRGKILANVAADGSIINLHNTFQSDLQARVSTFEPVLSPQQAVDSAATAFGFVFSDPLVALSNEGGPQQRIVFSGGGVSRNDIAVKLVFHPDSNEALRLAWDLEIYQMDGQHWWSLRIDSETGKIIDRDDYVDSEDFIEQARQAGHSPVVATGPVDLNGSLKSNGPAADSYMVYEIPRESPLHNPQGTPGPPTEGRTLQTDPAMAAASPFGWHDTDGAAGPEFTITQGNNVHAYEDGNNPGFSPDCGPTLLCNFPLDLSMDPDTFESASVVNLFYWNNIVHDVTYAYGFDEAAGNFQENNYGNGGAGSDYVTARAQLLPNDCNAFFGTPEDGLNPDMLMYVCTNISPARDGALDNGVVIHEYGHGVSNRLTGGPSNVACLNNSEQMGEGWSDYLALALTMEAGDLGSDSRGIGTYLFGQPPTGAGIRPQPYSTDFGTNDSTYDDIDSVSIPHGLGWVWASMLWEMTWELVDNGVSQNGFDPDLATGTGGNNLAMQLIMDGMKLQPCSPGFVDGRDAILAADLAVNGGVNQCAIWTAFARRGLGFSADQGSSSSTSDGTEAFDLPNACLEVLKIEKTANPDPAHAGSNIEYTLTVTNDTPGPLTGVTITDTVPADTTYVVGSATCGGFLATGDVIFPIGAMASGASVSCTFEAQIDLALSSTVFFFDDFDGSGPLGAWTPTGLWNNDTEGDPCGSLVAPFPSPVTAAYYGDDTTCTYDTGSTTSGELTMTTPIALTGAAPQLRVHSFEETENSPSYDRRTVDISIDSGSNWTELLVLTTEGSWYQASADLTPYVGDNVLIRFHFDSVDGISNDYLGWLIDDVEVIDEAAISNTACVTATEGDNACDTAVTPVLPGVFSIDIAEDAVDVCAGDDVVVDVNVVSLGGAAPVTLSAQSSPAGASMAFDTNPVVPTGISALTVTAPATDYTVTVEGDDGAAQANDAFTITVLPAASASTLLSPSDGSIDVVRPPTFSWSVDAAATGYLLEIATDAGFADIVYSTNTPATSDTVWSLVSATTYHWRATPNNACGPGATSVSFSMTTETALFEDGFESGDTSAWTNISP